MHGRNHLYSDTVWASNSNGTKNDFASSYPQIWGRRLQGFWGSSWRAYIGVTTGGIVGLELAGIQRSDNRMDSGA